MDCEPNPLLNSSFLLGSICHRIPAPLIGVDWVLHWHKRGESNCKLSAHKPIQINGESERNGFSRIPYILFFLLCLLLGTTIQCLRHIFGDLCSVRHKNIIRSICEAPIGQRLSSKSMSQEWHCIGWLSTGCVPPSPRSRRCLFVEQVLERALLRVYVNMCGDDSHKQAVSATQNACTEPSHGVRANCSRSEQLYSTPLYSTLSSIPLSSLSHILCHSLLSSLCR